MESPLCTESKKAHRRQSRNLAGPVRRAGGGGRGGGGPRAAAPGGAERRVDGVRHASVELSPYSTDTCHMAQLWLVRTMLLAA